MIVQKNWIQRESLSSLNEDYFNDELSEFMQDFINSGNYKNYYTNHSVIEINKNVARLFNNNTDEYVAIGFFNIEK